MRIMNVVKLTMVLQAAVDTKRMMPGQKAETLSILHFNDVYNVESREVEPVGGAARYHRSPHNYNYLLSEHLIKQLIISTFIDSLM